MHKDDRWIVDHFEELVTKYAGRYIAVVNEQVVVVGRRAKEVDDTAREKYPDHVPSVLFVPREEDLICALFGLIMPFIED